MGGCYKSKRVGELGVKVLIIVNLALLSKWRWMIISILSLLWSDICKVRYEAGNFSSPLDGRIRGVSMVSHCWRCISFLGGLSN